MRFARTALYRDNGDSPGNPHLRLGGPGLIKESKNQTAVQNLVVGNVFPDECLRKGVWMIGIAHEFL
jgi:hypothetical protein